MYSVDSEVSVDSKAVFHHVARFRVRHLNERLVLLSEFLNLLYVQLCSCTRLCTCARLSFSDTLIYFVYVHTVCFSLVPPFPLAAAIVWLRVSLRVFAHLGPVSPHAVVASFWSTHELHLLFRVIVVTANEVLDRSLGDCCEYDEQKDYDNRWKYNSHNIQSFLKIEGLQGFKPCSVCFAPRGSVHDRLELLQT